MGTTTHYVITGMTCGHCVKAVTEEVSALPGVTDVSVTLEGGAMSVTADQTPTDEAIAEAVGEAGSYTVART